MPLHLSESNLLMFSHSVVSDSETPLTAAHQASLSFTISWSLLNSCPSNHLILCHPPFLSSIFPSIRVFPMSQLFASGSQRTGVSASTSVFPKSIQGSFSLRLTGLISFLYKGLSRVFSSTQFKSINCLAFLKSSSHICT